MGEAAAGASMVAKRLRRLRGRFIVATVWFFVFSFPSFPPFFRSRDEVEWRKRRWEIRDNQFLFQVGTL